MTAYDAALARAIDRHTAGPTCEGFTVSVQVQLPEWQGRHQVQALVEVTFGEDDGVLVEAEDEQGTIDLANFTVAQRTHVLTADEQEQAGALAEEAERDERDAALESRADMDRDEGRW